ncbi:MAG: SnoaL-like domain protein [Actinomycetia bacterium]|jgi:ketosteroid isomerase-like protein|nr:SnoaL-like domain protein [Actinomycetes bacterium]
MTESASPREIFMRLSSGISAGRWHELATLYADDAVVEQPFAVPPAPARLEGRDVIDTHFRAAADGPLELRASNVVVHETTDPEVIIAEFDYQGRITTADHDFTVANIQVLRVRDGLILATRDYHDHLGLAQGMGRLPDLLTALTADDE